MNVRSMLSVVLALCGSALWAEQVVISSDVTNWEGLTISSEDEILIKAGVTAKVTTRAALEQIKDCSRIRPETPTSRFEIVVPAGETWTNFCPMSAVNLAGAGNIDFANGEIYKTGEGVLVLQPKNHLFVGTKPGSYTLYDWWTGLTAAEGQLRLPPVESDGTHYVGYVTVSNGASFFMVESGCDTYVRGLFGDGLVTNASMAVHSLISMGERNVNLESDFCGTLGGAIKFIKDKDGVLRLHGTNSTFTGAVTLKGGVIGVGRFGRKDDAASTIGAAISLDCQSDSEFRVLYLGEGEATDKELFVKNQSSKRFLLDGGATGGLVWQGNLRPQTDAGQMREVVFTGAGAEECVFDGLLYGNYSSGTTVYGGLYYAKEGIGTWRFADHYERRAATGFAIREGVLAFDSLDEQGRLCSLGLATNLTAGAGAAPFAAVDYAFTLGSTDATLAQAVFAYTGTNSCQTSTRSIALAGDGHLRNDTARRFRLVGVKSLGIGATTKTLVLDGAGANTNEVADIIDGAAGYSTGVTKDGAGTWKISGDLTFSGPLSVKGGTLIVKKTQSGAYKWFRWTIREKYDAKDNNEININSLAFLDENVVLQSSGLKLNDHYAELEPGQFGFQTVFSRVDLEYTPGNPASMTHPEKMFVTGNNYGMWAKFLNPKNTSGVGVKPDPSDPKTWWSLVVRLPDSAATIDSFDYSCTWGKNRKWLTVKTSTLEGSVDGLHWNMLTENVSENLANASWLWTVGGESSGSAPTVPGAKVDGATDRTYSTLTGNPAVTVAPGATLVADGDVSISKLSIDGEKGVGTIDGFAFDDEGTIDIVGDKSKFLDKAPAVIRSASIGNVSSWNVTVNGRASAYKVTATADGFNIIKPGILMIVR